MPDENQVMNPFPGPRPYEEDEGKLFFARGKDERELQNLIINHSVVVLHGPTGCGKSSLMRAKVLPSVASRAEIRYFRSDLWPPSKPLIDSLVDGMFRKSKRNPNQWDDLLEALRDNAANSNSSRYSLALELLGQMSDEGIVIYVDQFEELLRLDRKDPERGKDKNQLDLFVQELLASVHRSDVSVKLVIGVRDDYLSLFQHRLRDYPLLLAEGYRLERLTRQQFVDGACAAAALGIPPPKTDWNSPEIKQSIDSAMVAVQCDPHEQSPSAEVEAPFAQIILQRIWNERLAAETAASGIRTKVGSALQAKDVVQEYFTDTLRKLPSTLQDQKFVDIQASARRILEELVDKQGNRAIVPLEVKKYPAGEKIVEVLKQASILRSESRDGYEFFQISHDLLAQEVQTWQQERASAEAARKRRDLVIMAAVTLLIIAGSSIVLAMWMRAERDAADQAKNIAEDATENANKAKYEAEKAKTRFRSKALLNGVDDLLSQERFADAAALLKAVPSVDVERADLDRWQTTVLEATSRAEFAILRGHKSNVRWAEWSPKGNLIVTASADGTIGLWGPEGRGNPTFAETKIATEVVAIAMDGDEKELFACWKDGLVKRWSIVLAERKFQPPISYSMGRSLITCAFDDSKKHIVAVAEDGSVFTPNEPGREPTKLIAFPDKLLHASYSATSRTVVGIDSKGLIQVANLDTSRITKIEIAAERKWVPKQAVANEDGQKIAVIAQSLEDEGIWPLLVFVQKGSPPNSPTKDESWKELAMKRRVQLKDLRWIQGDQILVLTDSNANLVQLRKTLPSREIKPPPDSNIDETWTLDWQSTGIVLPKSQHARLDPASGNKILLSSNDKTARIFRFNKPWERPKAWKEHGLTNSLFHLSGDGRRALYRDSNPGDAKKQAPVKVFELPGWKDLGAFPELPRSKDPRPGPLASPTFISRDGAFVGQWSVSEGNRGLSIFDTRLSPPTHVGQFKDLSYSNASFATHTPSHQFAYAADKKVFLCRLPLEAACNLFTDGDAPDDLWFSADGKLLITTNTDGMIIFWDIATKTKVGQYEPGTAVDRMFLHDRWLVTSSGQSAAKLWKLKQARPIPNEEPTSLATDIADAVFDEEGRRLLVKKGDYFGGQRFRRVWLYNLDKPESGQAYQHPARIMGMRFGDDADQVVLIDAAGNQDTISITKDMGVGPIRAKLDEVTYCALPKARRKYLGETDEEAKSQYETCERFYRRKPVELDTEEPDSAPAEGPRDDESKPHRGRDSTPP